jgi:hypothetical protein
MRLKAKVPKKLGTNIWFLLHDHAPAHRPVFIKDLLTTLQHPPYYPDRLQLVFTYYPGLNQH